MAIEAMVNLSESPDMAQGMTDQREFDQGEPPPQLVAAVERLSARMGEVRQAVGRVIFGQREVVDESGSPDRLRY